TDTLVKQAFPSGQDPLGRHIRLNFLAEQLPPPFTKATGAGDPTFEIVGVVGTFRNAGLERPPAPAAYIPSSWVYPPGTQILVRTSGDPLALTEPARRTISSIAPGQP